MQILEEPVRVEVLFIITISLQSAKTIDHGQINGQPSLRHRKELGHLLTHNQPPDLRQKVDPPPVGRLPHKDFKPHYHPRNPLRIQPGLCQNHGNRNQRSRQYERHHS